MIRDIENQQTKQDYSVFHSDDVQEIMGRQPPWLLRWGITIIFLILLTIIVTGYYIRYPQTVTAALTLTSDNPPSYQAVKAMGNIDSVYVSDGERVQRGKMLALIASAARYEDVVCVDNLLKTGRVFSEMDTAVFSSFQLGDMQQGWIEYLSVISDYNNYIRIDPIGKKKALLSEQARCSKEYLCRLDLQRGLMYEDLKNKKSSFERDSIMFQESIISQEEYETSFKSYLSKNNSLLDFEALMTSTLLDCFQIEQQILELDTQQTMNISEYEHKLVKSRNLLLGQIALWKEQYTIIAPFDGVVSLRNLCEKGQRVNVGDVIMSVMPSDYSKIIGRMRIPSVGYGKVKTGQEVNIKLNGFPYFEFGIIKGEVASISSIPERTQEGITFSVDVILPKDLESTYHLEIPFVQDMDGIAEIITDEIRLIELFFMPIRSLLLNKQTKEDQGSKV